MKELQTLMDDIAEFSDKTFGIADLSRAFNILNHLKREIDETQEAINEDAKPGSGAYGKANLEYADMFILLLDSARCYGIDAKLLIKLTENKMIINKRRKWGKQQSNDVIEHIEE